MSSSSVFLFNASGLWDVLRPYSSIATKKPNMLYIPDRIESTIESLVSRCDERKVARAEKADKVNE